MRYLVRLAPAAERIIRALEPYDQQGLDRVLSSELLDGPNADKEIRFDSDGAYVYAGNEDAGNRVCYTATPLSFKAYTAIHRPMTEDELSRMSWDGDGQEAGLGFYISDILPAESAFTRRPGGLAARPAKPAQGDLPPDDDDAGRNHSVRNPRRRQPRRAGPK